jgi:hypothetical protein
MGGNSSSSGGSGKVLTGDSFAAESSGDTASITFKTDGSVIGHDNGGVFVPGKWLESAPDYVGAALFEGYFHKVDGTTAGVTRPTNDTWLPMNVDRVITVVDDDIAGRFISLEVTIREIAYPSNTVTFTVDVSAVP